MGTSYKILILLTWFISVRKSTLTAENEDRQWQINCEHFKRPQHSYESRERPEPVYIYIYIYIYVCVWGGVCVSVSVCVCVGVGVCVGVVCGCV